MHTADHEYGHDLSADVYAGEFTPKRTFLARLHACFRGLCLPGHLLFPPAPLVRARCRTVTLQQHGSRGKRKFRTPTPLPFLAAPHSRASHV